MAAEKSTRKPKLCACGCKRPIVPQPWHQWSRPKFRPGHRGKRVTTRMKRTGVCACGCGQKTTVFKKNAKSHGQFEGVPAKFVHGHNRRGKAFSRDHRRKISAAKVGVTKSLEHRQKLSAALRKHPGISGSAHYNWRGGIDQRRPDVHFWTRAVKRRDGNTCQVCGYKSETGKGLHAHHLWSWVDFPEKRYDVDNGVTLCASCHRQKPVHRTPTTLADLLMLDIERDHLASTAS